MADHGPVTHPDITVCVCTYKRAALQAAVESVARQGAAGVVVIDNDAAGSARPLVEELRQALPTPITYVHAPDRNISIARNAALDAVVTPWLAFIDDDETAAVDWLDTLAAGRDGSAAVIGQVIATYGDGLPAWAPALDFHSNRIEPGERADNGYTSNALLDLAFVRAHGLRFALDCGVTGGEDTLFFRSITTAGGGIRYCPRSVVHEVVTPERATLGWVLRRKFRSGQTHGLLLSRFSPALRRTLPLSAAAKTAYSATRAALSLFRPQRAIWWLARTALHAGAFVYCLRPHVLEEYRQ